MTWWKTLKIKFELKKKEKTDEDHKHESFSKKLILRKCEKVKFLNETDGKILLIIKKQLLKICKGFDISKKFAFNAC